jgi:alkylation response protein AidB-like acyl-CoA dehydrogenase
VPDTDGSWPTARTAAAVAGIVGAAGRRLPVGAHLAAAATLTRIGHEGSALGALGVITDIRPGDGGRLVGRCWGPARPDLLVLAAPEGGLGLAAGDACELGPDPMPSFDEVDVWHVSLPAEAVEHVGDARARQVHDAGIAFFLAAEALGAVQDTTERTLAYLKDRQAFGQPLGAFQALQHRAVDVYTVSRMAISMIEVASSAWERPEHSLVESWLAKVFTGTRGVWAAEQAIQLHGGIGFTWELGLHHALRRTQRARLLLGGPVRASAAVVRGVQADPRPGLTDWTLRPIPRGTGTAA